MIKMRVISSGHKSMNTPQIRATHEPAAQGVGGWVGGGFLLAQIIRFTSFLQYRF